MAGDERLRKLLEATIQKEVRRQIQLMLPAMVKEAMVNVMSGLISEGVDRSRGNSEKRTAVYSNTPAKKSLTSMLADDELNEVSAVRKNRGKYAKMFGYGDDVNTLGAGGMPGIAAAPSTVRSSNLIVPDAKMGGEFGQGMPVPVDPDEIPDHLLEAFNKDYTSILKAAKVIPGA